MEKPLVSVTVITYNSSKTVLETLESIKEQTYQNIELIVSDDCSTDNTVEICRNWIEQNKDRFVHTELLTVDKNTGVSGNLNRAESACMGEWIKGIAGDDILMPNCIQECMDYVKEHPKTVYLFGRCKAFGADEEYCKKIDHYFNYSFFGLKPEQQLHRLIFDGNCVPATTLCYNRDGAAKIGIKNDERIPLLEDWPKWINLLRAGVKFHFIDKVLVKYRVGGLTTQNRRLSMSQYRSERLMRFYYQYPEWYKEDQNAAIERMINEECEVYQCLLDAETEEQALVHHRWNQYKALYERYYKDYNQVIHSRAYRIGKLLLKPFKWLKR